MKRIGIYPLLGLTILAPIAVLLSNGGAAVSAGLPDLYPSKVTSSLRQSNKTGACSFKINVTVTNGGTANAGPFYITFQDSTGIVVGNVLVNGLNAGNSVTKSATTSAGKSETKLVNIFVDPSTASLPSGQVVESNETNNNTSWSGTCP